MALTLAMGAKGTDDQWRFDSPNLVQRVWFPRVLIHITVVVLLFVGVFVCSVPAAAKADPAPQWAVDAAKTSRRLSAITPPPSFSSTSTYYRLRSGPRVEREREAIRILKPQAVAIPTAPSAMTSTKSLTTFAHGPFRPTAASSRPWKLTSSIMAPTKLRICS